MVSDQLGEQIDAVVHGRHPDPHSVLGGHPGRSRTTLRALRPDAETVTAIIKDERIPLRRIHDGRVFDGTVPGNTVPDYKLEVVYADGRTFCADDPYRYLPTLGELDLHLLGEGRHEDLWKSLG